MVSIIHLLLIIQCLSIGIYCEKFCENPILSSALTIDYNKTYLFRDTNYWYLMADNSSVTKNSSLISQDFESVNGYNTSIKLDKIDAIFWTNILTERGDVDTFGKVLYVFYENLYFFLQIAICKDNGIERKCIRTLQADNRNSIPNNWNYYGGLLSDWFPHKIDATLRVTNTLLLFHGSTVRVIGLNLDKPEHMNKTWPTDEKVDIPFDGSLKSEVNIDAIFEMPLTEDIVITSGLNYCRFNRIQIDFKLNIPKTFNISCEWKPTKYLFYCEIPIITTTQVIITKDLDLNDSTIGTQSNIDPNNEPNDYNWTTVSEKKKNSDLILAISVAVFSVMAILVISSIACIAYFASRRVNGTDSQTKGSSFGQMSSNIDFDTPSMASIVTVNSTTGLKLDGIN